MSKSLNISPAVIYSAVQKSKIYNQDHLVSSLGYCQLRALSQITCTARSIEIVPRGKPPLKMGGPPLEFINRQPRNGGPPLGTISMDLAVCTLWVHGMIFVRHLRQKSLNSVTTTQNRAPIFRVVKIGLKSVKKVVLSIIIFGWGT